MPKDTPKLNLQQKLGHLYEDALTLLLEASARYDLLERNLQLQKDAHTTIGELDFLLSDLKSSDLIHLELATKFYLAVESESNSGIQLPGPDARDNYARKLHRMRSHQLPILTEHRDHLPDLYREETIVTQQLIYGCFFDHIHAKQEAQPPFSLTDGRRGRWLTADEALRHFAPNTKFEIIPKALWPVPLPGLVDVALEDWSPREPRTLFLMLRVGDEPTPYCVAPNGYPSH